MKTKISNFLVLVWHFPLGGFWFSVFCQKTETKFPKIQIGPKKAYHHPKEQKKTSRVTLGAFSVDLTRSEKKTRAFHVKICL